MNKKSNVKLNTMTEKENKGGELSNGQIEQDLRIRNKNGSAEGGYVGMQDTGDTGVRQKGTEVQQRDGQPEENKDDPGV